MQRTITLWNKAKKPTRKKRNLRKVFELKERKTKGGLITRKEQAHFNRIDKNIQFLQDMILKPLQTNLFEPYIKPALEHYKQDKNIIANDDNFIVRRLVTYKRGPQMDAKWWFYNFLLLLIPAGLLVIFLEYETREMHRILTEMELNDKGRILGPQNADDGSYQYDYDEALLRLEYDNNKSDIQKRTEKKMILQWIKEDQMKKDLIEKKVDGGMDSDSILQRYLLKQFVDCYNYLKGLYYSAYNHDQKLDGGKEGNVTSVVETKEIIHPMSLAIETNVLQKEDIIVDNEIIKVEEDTSTLSPSWWNTISSYIPYISTHNSDENDQSKT